MVLLGDVRGGIAFTKKDVYNLWTNLMQGLTFKDMAVTIKYFHKKKIQVESHLFFYAVKLDENQTVGASFWVDGRTMALYQNFRDCVFFDTTFITNCYDMSFAPLVGINNHMQTILPSCALIPGETTKIFVWLFERNLESSNEWPTPNLYNDISR